MADIDWNAAANHWIDQEPSETRMPLPELKAHIEEFIGARKICALACAGNGIVRNTPVEYVFARGAFWIFSEGGLKYRALEACPDVCLAIFDENPTFGQLKSLQVTGTAEVVEPFGEEYAHACELRGLPIERLKKFPFVMNVIKVVPTRYDLLESSLKAEGFSSRQHLTAEELA